ncbi:XisI protein [Oscillatoria sp. FACHB-1406]|uniref:XisI protein n=1 Tax=Oscillatoria sp. FACHB-1406 TaxID=2692846 RepID=UPI00168814E4|nr:XisI protein [Oscillatoria sp. FACHB-1406]MBD2580084.1 XisI protein [Oscillatoria sp. FACHB-1406]
MAVNPNDVQIQVPPTKCDRYRQVVMQFLKQFVGYSGDREEIETQQIFDLQTDRYLILSLGWRGQERVYVALIHLDIQDEKVWIQRNQTESQIEEELIALGIPQEDIVRGLIPPEYRVLAGFNSST